jgi:hypothetical protein
LDLFSQLKAELKVLYCSWYLALCFLFGRFLCSSTLQSLPYAALFSWGEILLTSFQQRLMHMSCMSESTLQRAVCRISWQAVLSRFSREVLSPSCSDDRLL